MNINDIIKSRYSTKEFDKSKKLSDGQIEQIEDLLQFSPSSTNIQPWHFVIAVSDNAKQKVAKASQGFFSFNLSKIENCSAVVIFASITDLKDEYLEHLLEEEDKDGRFENEEFRNQNHLGRRTFAYMHKLDYKDFQQWVEKQVYLNLGSFLVGIAAMGIDAVAMEGLDFKIIDEEFGLRNKGYTSCVAVSIGWHSDNDFNKNLPKSRLTKKEIIEKV